MYPSQRYARLAQERISSLPPPYRWLDPEDVKFIGEHPVAAGGFANVYEATHDGRKVMLKSYRPYMSFDIARVVAVCCNDSLRLYRVFRRRLLQRFYNEVYVSSLLHHEDVDVAPLVGVYSTEAHPFGLVYEYMDSLDLRQCLRNESHMEKLKLVLIPMRFLPFPSSDTS